MWAQEMVSGLVIEETSNGKFKPVQFANVHWLGTQTGTATDTSGYFELPFDGKNKTLVFSYVGYKTDTVNVEQPDKLTVVLKHQNQLDEVEVVYRQRGTEISYMDPMKTETIGEKELYKAACCNLSESFETNPSVDAAYTDAVTGTRQIQMLGLDGKYSQITRESMPDVRGLASVQGLSYIPGTWVESIQLNKGAGSVVNGFESVTGQINVEMPKADLADAYLLNGYVNRGGRTELNLNTAHRLGDKVSTGFLLHGNVRPFEVDGNGDGFLDFPTGYQVTGVNRWRFSGTSGWEGQINARGLTEKKSGGQFAQDAFGNEYNVDWTTNRAEVWGKTGYSFKNHKYKSIGIQGSLLYHDYVGQYGNTPYLANQISGYGNVIYQSILSTTTHKYRTGASVSYDAYDETLDSINYTRTEIVPGAFFEYTYTYFEKFALVAGLRADYHNYYGAFLTPRLHVRYAIKEGSVLRFSGGRGQRTANAIAENMNLLASSRIWQISGNGSIPGFGLKPEVAWNVGANFTQDFRLNYKPATLAVDFYHTEFENQTVVDIESPREVRIYNLQGRSYSTSFQTQFDYELYRNFDVRAAYRWYDVMTEYSGTLKRKPFIASHRAFINLGYETNSDWMFDVTGIWHGIKRIPNTEANSPVNQMRKNSPSLFHFNAQVTKTWKDRFAVYVGMENITNVRQNNPIIAADNAFGPEFDASMIWGPIFGRMMYMGFRLTPPKKA